MHASGAISHILSTCCAAMDCDDDEGAGNAANRIFPREKCEAECKREGSKREAKRKQNGSKTEANNKQNASKPEAKRKQRASKKQANGKQKESTQQSRWVLFAVCFSPR